MGMICGINAPNFEFRYSIEGNQPANVLLHCHVNYELYYFKSGIVDYYIEGKKYTLVPNTLLLMGPQTFHGCNIRSSEAYERYVINFSDKFVSDNCKRYLKSIYDNSKNNMTHCFLNTEEFNIESFFMNIINCKKMEQKLREKALVANFEALIYQISFMSVADKADDITYVTTPDKINEMIIYINANIGNTFSLDDLSKQFFISKHHLNKVFKQATGTTVMEYILYKKIAKAQFMILNGETISKVALDLGFGDYSNFYRNYKKILGHSPSQDSVK